MNIWKLGIRDCVIFEFAMFQRILLWRSCAIVLVDGGMVLLCM